MAASGDVLLHAGLWAQAAADAKASGRTGYDFRQILSGVKSVISEADLAICHLETSVGQPAGPFSGYPRFVVPPQIASALRETGYDSCSTASNHSLDDGEHGIRRTLDVLDAAGLSHAGTARSPAEHDKTTIVTVRGVRVALLSYTFSFNGLKLPQGKEWLANSLRAATVLDEAKRARRAGAEIVITSVHWGTEYNQTVDLGQTSLAKQLLSSPDIDLLLGHHAHVVQPFERIGDKWVAYGLGNHIARQPQRETTSDGVVARMTFKRSANGRWIVSTAMAVPTWMDITGTYQRGAMRLVSVSAMLSERSIAAGLRKACTQSLRRTSTALASRGATSAGLVIVQPSPAR